MSRQVGTVPSVRSCEAAAGRALFWSKVFWSAKDPDLVTICLFSVIGLLVSLYLAAAFDIPAAESLLQMPG